MSESGTTVAILGAGRMGGAMAGTLARSGFGVVVWNRGRAKADDVGSRTGATVARTAAEAVASADLAITSLADDDAVVAVCSQLAEGLRPGHVVLEMSTIAPQTVRQVAPAIEARGATLLDAPVSGSVPLVETGTLLIMVGGDAAALERVRPVLDALSKKVIHVGGLGSGATIKLAVNGLVHGLGVALSEALVLAERAGIERTTAYEVFASGAAAAPFVLYKRPAFERPDETPVAFSLGLVAKDLDLILALAAEVGAPMRQGEANRAAVRDALDAGLGARDLSALATHLRQTT